MSLSARTGTSPVRRLVGLLVTVLAVFVASLHLLTGGSAYAVDNASISGTVTGPSGPQSGVCVTAYDGDADYRDFFGDAETTTNGTYSITGLPAGNYKVEFDDCTGHGLVTEWFADKPDFASATVFALAAGGARPGVDAALVLGGTVTGTVTVPNGYSTGGVCVAAYNSADSYSLDDTYLEVEDGGQYRVSGLPGGPVRLEFRDCTGQDRYVTEWYDDQPSYASATPVPVVVGQTTTGRNALLALTGGATGTVTGPTGPLGDICVSASGTDQDADDYNYGFDETDAQGHYDIVGLDPGPVVVHFYDCGSNNVVGEYYNDKPSSELADPVTITAGQVTSGINAQLAAGATIRGRITGPTGAGVMACVDGYDADGDYLNGTESAADGTYILDGLPSGQVLLEFSDCEGGDLVSEYYNDQATFDAANPVTVQAGQVVPGINAQLATGGRITGTVTGPGGALAPDVCVTVFDLGNNEVAYAATGPDGTYTANALRPGVVKVVFDPCDGQPLRSEWYNDKPSFATANQVTVVGGQTSPGISAQLASDGTPTPTGAPTATPPTTTPPTPPTTAPTSAPTTGGPTTTAPTTVPTPAPTTGGPTTGAPTTAPTTGAPTTAPTTTGAPTTAPSTGVPTTPPTTAPPTTPPTTPAPPAGPSAACAAATSALTAATNGVAAAQAKVKAASAKAKKVKKASGASSAKAKAARKKVAKAKAALKAAQSRAATASSAKTASC